MAFEEIIAQLWSLGGFIFGLGVLGVLAVTFKWVEVGKAKWVAGIIAGVVAVAGLNVAGVIDLFGGNTPAPAVIIPSSQIQSAPSAPSQPQDLVQPAPLTAGGVGGACDKQSDGTNTLDIVIRNKENVSSLGYLSGSAAAEVGDLTQDTATTTGGASLSYTALNVPPCKSGTIYVLGTNGVGVASAKMAFSSFETVSKYEMLSAGNDVVAVQAYDRQSNTESSGIANGSNTLGDYFVSGAGTTGGNAYVRNTTLGTGGSKQGFVVYNVNGTQAVFGTYGATDGVILSFDSVDGAIFSKTALGLSEVDEVGLTEVTCPQSVAANRNADRCWSAQTFKDTEGDIWLKYQLQSDLGNPTETGDNPVLCIDDKAYFRGADGNVKYDFYSEGGTNQGAASVCVNWVVA